MCFKWLNSKVKKMRWYDVSLTKLSVAGFILMIAKLWPPLISLEWYWYLVIGVLAAIIPTYDVLTKK